MTARGRLDGRRGARVRYVHRLADIAGIGAAEQERLAPVVAAHAFRATDYYLGLIDWKDPGDPIRRIVVPDEDELSPWGSLDPSAEASNRVAPGVQHKYARTALLLCNETCAGHCRYCFRKRIFVEDDNEIATDLSEGLAYIAAHTEISNVLLTGGDPLNLSTPRLVAILDALSAIPHVGLIRIGTKMPAFNPWRLLDDAPLLAALRRISTPRRRLHIVTHFDHPRELTDDAVAAVAALLEAGAVCANQNPVIRGVNDRADVLTELFRQLSWIGSSAYYVFQCRPTIGNRPYAVPIVEAFHTFDRARAAVSGLAKRARFVLSHETGKIEVLAVDDQRVYMRYHRARNPDDEGRFLIFRRDDAAYWLDDLAPYDVPFEPPIPAERSFLLTAGPE